MQLFQLRNGMGLVGKDLQKGEIPVWSYVLWFPFHIPTLIYTYFHTRFGTQLARDVKTGKTLKIPVPVASEVLPGKALI